MNRQVDKTHYQFESYLSLDRWASYFYQLREILSLKPRRMLEIGIGDGVVGNYLKHHTSISYASLDIATDLNPDLVGDVTRIPAADRSFDLACAFEVLEHLPFSQFELALEELRRVTGQWVIISLPHFGPPVKFVFKVPFLSEVRFAFKLPWPKSHCFNGEHYWEIGKKGYPEYRIRKVLKKYFIIRREFVPFENQYHHFYILEKKSL